jgi:hypothetical protein
MSLYFGTAAGAGASFRVNSAELLRYQIVAPLTITASRTISVSSMPKQDFIAWKKDAQLSAPPARSGLSNREWTPMDANGMPEDTTEPVSECWSVRF